MNTKISDEVKSALNSERFNSAIPVESRQFESGHFVQQLLDTLTKEKYMEISKHRNESEENQIINNEDWKNLYEISAKTVRELLKEIEGFRDKYGRNLDTSFWVDSYYLVKEERNKLQIENEKLKEERNKAGMIERRKYLPLLNDLKKSINDLFDVLNAHEIETLDCDRRGNKYCSCLQKAINKVSELINKNYE